jgi:hypothetical protein
MLTSRRIARSVAIAELTIKGLGLAGREMALVCALVLAATPVLSAELPGLVNRHRIGIHTAGVRCSAGSGARS